jgi:hypothetical protein
MLEHAVRLNLVQRGLQETLLVHLVIVIIGKRAELLSLLVQELEIGSALVLNVAVQGFLNLFLVPLNLAVPVVVLIVIIYVVIEGEVGLLGSILAHYKYGQWDSKRM